MSRPPTTHLVLGLFFLAFALLLAFVWVPMDVDTGVIEKVRRRVTIGDSLAPMVAAVFLGAGGLLLFVVERRAKDQPRVSSENLGFVAKLLVAVLISFAIMRWAGPISLGLFGPEEAEYRLMRDTAPWKHIGFFLGGTFMITAMVCLVEGRFRPRTLLVAVLATLVMIAVYDLPFDDLLLPPNGDV